MKDIYIVGDDPVTKAIICRLIKDYSHQLKIALEIPARGGQIKGSIAKFNRLAESTPVVLLLDLDANNCAPELKRILLNGMEHNPRFVINVAVDEGESWLFADKENFARYLHLDPALTPNSCNLRMNGPRMVREVYTEQKPSRLLTHGLALRSSDTNIRKQIGVNDVNEKCKGNEYNAVIVPFIYEVWNPEVARQNSDSLNRMILRIQQLDLNN